MQKDIRATEVYREVEALYRRLRQPGSGLISDAVDLAVAPDGRHAVFAGTLIDKLEGAASTRLCRIDLVSGEMSVMSFGPNTDRLPGYSPDGRHIAFLSDRHQAGNFQLYLLDSHSGAVHAAPAVEGWVEYLQWSPDGRRILLGVAGHGADVAGSQGAVATQRHEGAPPGWMPSIESGDEAFRWRSAWLYELETNEVHRVAGALNIWEAAWCGSNALVAVASAAPAEAAWYTAALQVIDLISGEGRLVCSPKDQLGCPAASPSGTRLAIIEAVCSDRGLVAGELLMLDPKTGATGRVMTHGVDVTHLSWRSETRLLIGGHRGFETVVLEHDVTAGTVEECWASAEISGSGLYVRPIPLGEGSGDCLLITEGFVRPPEIGCIRQRNYRTVRRFDLGGRARVDEWMASIEQIVWSAPDALEIQGWLLCPPGPAPHPLVMNVHGGPVYHWRPRWLGRAGSALADLMLLKHGYAIFYPNPRGSSGRGVDFARRVQGDLGGAETQDHLSGLDHLIERGSVDPRRLGVTGGSHGGFMTSWLITQDRRFAAAVPVAPVTDRVSQYLTCTHSYYVALFLADKYDRLGGRFFQRSPIMHAHNARTPTLHIAGALDRCTPPGQAVEFHNALREQGVRSVLAIYPEEGHGVRKLPAAFDYAARVVMWFDEHMRAGETR
jgi:dipeptidyl aminopeptidase/acylaminoacyl peptidase